MAGRFANRAQIYVPEGFPERFPVTSRPFTMRTLPPPSETGNPGRADVIRKLSRQRYGRTRRQVEEDIERQYGHG